MRSIVMALLQAQACNRSHRCHCRARSRLASVYWCRCYRRRQRCVGASRALAGGFDEVVAACSCELSLRLSCSPSHLTRQTCRCRSSVALDQRHSRCCWNDVHRTDHEVLAGGTHVHSSRSLNLAPDHRRTHARTAAASAVASLPPSTLPLLFGRGFVLVYFTIAICESLSQPTLSSLMKMNSETQVSWSCT